MASRFKNEEESTAIASLSHALSAKNNLENLFLIGIFADGHSPTILLGNYRFLLCYLI